MFFYNLTSSAKMYRSVISLFLFILSCQGFDFEQFLSAHCQQTDFKYFNDQSNVNIDLLCQNFNFTTEEIQDIQHRDFIISNKTTIYIENANIGTVNEKFFSKFPNAQELILRDVEMKMDTFDIDGSNTNYSKLKTLRLLHCRITENKGTSALSTHQSLDMLEIRSTTFENKDLEESFLESCTNLKKITITNSEISKIERDTFRKLPLLRYLDLSHLGLSGDSLSSYALVSNKNLEYLDLSANNLEDILFLPGSLKFFNASSNKISKISKPDFQDLLLLEELSLDDNNLEEIPEDCFVGLKNLQMISLSGNQIRSIFDNTFKSLPKLDNLNLQWNLMVHSPTGLDNIMDFKFEPQKEETKTTTRADETSTLITDFSTSSSTELPTSSSTEWPTTSSSTETPTTSSSTETPTTTSQTSTVTSSTTDAPVTTLKPAQGCAQTVPVTNIAILSSLMSLYFYF